MFKRNIKRLLRSQFVHNLIVFILWLYVKFVYATSRFHYQIAEKSADKNLTKGILAIWHNQLVMGIKVLDLYQNIQTLASNHPDALIIADIMKQMGYKIIEGSSNRNSVSALMAIMSHISKGGKISITPDGPRGPVYQVNSNITNISYKLRAPILPISCFCSRYIEINSWDRMVIPLPFCKIIITIGEPIFPSGDSEQDKADLEKTLMSMLELNKKSLNR